MDRGSSMRDWLPNFKNEQGPVDVKKEVDLSRNRYRGTKKKFKTNPAHGSDQGSIGGTERKFGGDNAKGTSPGRGGSGKI